MFYIYFIGIKGWNEDVQPIKIGKSNNPKSRLRELNTGSPYELEIKHYIPVPTENLALWGERLLHKKFREKKRHHEWFDVYVDDYELEECEEWLFEENPDFEWEYITNWRKNNETVQRLR